MPHEVASEVHTPGAASVKDALFHHKCRFYQNATTFISKKLSFNSQFPLFHLFSEQFALELVSAK